MKQMATYDLMETMRNTNEWLGASARAEFLEVCNGVLASWQYDDLGGGYFRWFARVIQVDARVPFQGVAIREIAHLGK